MNPDPAPSSGSLAPRLATGLHRPLYFRLSPFGRGWLRAYVLTWALVISLFVVHSLAQLSAYGWDDNPFHVARLTATGWLIRAAVALPFFAWMRHHTIHAASWRRDLLSHCAAMLAFVALENLVCWGAERILPFLPHSTLPRVYANEAHLDVLTYAILLGTVQAYEYYRKLHEREREAHEYALAASRLQTQLAEARLASLRMQLQPHFLYNTLHAISALIYISPETADRMLERLSDLLRLVLEHDDEPEVALRAELDVLDRYLSIQQMRFGDRLHVEHNVEPESLDIRVPALILQPLVENAIRHGIERRASGGRIAIRAHRQGDALRLEVEDDGPGLNAGVEHGGTGVGLANVRARLEQLHGSAGALRLESARGGSMRVVVIVPCQDPRVQA